MYARKNLLDVMIVKQCTGKHSLKCSLSCVQLWWPECAVEGGGGEACLRQIWRTR